MPTVSSHDVLGPMPWGAGGNARQRYFPQDSLDRSDARSGINSLLFEESGAAGACGVSVAAPSEHAYSSNRNSLVSANGYYGFHQQHGAAAADQDCTMDTDASENNPPGAHCAFGGSPSAGAVQEAFPLGSPHLWNADPLRIGLGSLGFAATRKRNLEARGLPLLPRGGWCEGVDAEDMGCGAKRTRPSLPSPKDAALAAQAMTEAPSQAMALEGDSFGMQVSAPSTSEQSHTPALVYELPIHQLPGSTSQLADAMTPRPRCLMGHFI